MGKDTGRPSNLIKVEARVRESTTEQEELFLKKGESFKEGSSMGVERQATGAWKGKSQLQEAFLESTHLRIWSKMALAPG